MRLEGRFFDGRSSRSRRASLLVEDGRVRVEGEAGYELLPPVPLESVAVSTRIGNTPRFLHFPGDASFESADNEAVDRLVAGRSPTHGLAHRLESKLRFAVAGLVVCAAFIWGSVQWGVPALAQMAASALPADVNRHVDRAALEILDRHLFARSRLADADQSRLLAAFAPLTRDGPEHPPVRVLFRDAGASIGANALALPAGTIVITDQLVRLAQHDEELVGVLAHEIGHLRHRHAMRGSLQASFVGLLATLVVGDVASVSSAIAALPAMLVELGYSRAFEREADRHAVALLRRHGIAPSRFADILQRLEPSKDDARAYLATHPPTPERVKAILSDAASLR